MKVVLQEPSHDQQFDAFNATAFPKRGNFQNVLTAFRYKNPLNPAASSNGNVLAFDDSNELVGQNLYHPATVWVKGEKKEAEWGFDFFVDPAKRADAAGIHIMEFVRDHKGLLFGTGLGPKAVKIQKFFGINVIGNLRKYVRLVHPLFALTGFFRNRQLKFPAFPNSVEVDGRLFSKVSADQLFDNTKPYNNNLIEFDRGRNFLKWRFFSPGFHYVLYSDGKPENPLYFVVRTTKIKRMTALVLADYRLSSDVPEDAALLFSAAIKVASRLWLPFVVSGSSLAVTDAAFEACGFKANGNDRPIVSNDAFHKISKENIGKRDTIFVTLADSDGEYLM